MNTPQSSFQYVTVGNGNEEPAAPVRREVRPLAALSILASGVIVLFLLLQFAVYKIAPPTVAPVQPAAAVSPAPPAFAQAPTGDTTGPIETPTSGPTIYLSQSTL